MNALIIGRFQPLHLGHVELIKEADSYGLEKIIIGIGIDGKERTPRNPFYYDEVREMWLPVLEKLATPGEIYSVPDIHDSEHYAGYVEGITGCNEKQTLIVSGNDDTIDCFTKYNRNYKVISLQKRIPLGNGEYLCATIVRKLMREGGNWEELVPESTKIVIENINGVDIVKSLYEEASII